MRILFIGMSDSVHTARWINQVTEQGWDIHLFSVNNGVPHQSFRNITIYGFSAFRPKELDRSVRLVGMWPLLKGSYKLSQQAYRFFPQWKWLNLLVRWLKPDLLHSLEIQRAGYLTQEAKSKFDGQYPSWIVTNWGSDIYLFGRLSEHTAKIKAVLSACDYYTCECHRDVQLARSFGFSGESLAVLPIAGGFDIKAMRQFRQPGPTSARPLIVLKGYQNWAGRALSGLRAIELCVDALEGYRVVVYLAGSEVKLACELLSHATGLPIEIVPKCSHEDILRLHGRARVSIGLSISDAISTSALEAMAMGSFPIQSNTSCFDEWVQNGETGMLVHPEDPAELAVALRRALTEDQLVDRAAEINYQIAIERLDKSVIQPQVAAMYSRIAGQARAKHG